MWSIAPRRRPTRRPERAAALADRVPDLSPQRSLARRPGEVSPRGRAGEWKERDPIRSTASGSSSSASADDVIAKIDADVRRVVDEPTEACKAAPNPPLDILTTDVTADGASHGGTEPIATR